MKGMVFTGGRTVGLMHFVDPTPGPGEAIVEIKASGMCGTDLHWYRHDTPSDVLKELGTPDLEARGIDPNLPIIAGHEPCGIVAAIGSGGDRSPLQVGDRVVIFHYEGCGFCGSCRTSWTQLCERGATVYGVTAHGGHAHYMKVPISSLIQLPSEISFAAGAAVACGTGTAYGGLLRLGITARDTLAVFGLGPVGLSAVQLAAAMGAEVIGIDISADRVERAKAFGAAHVVNATERDPVEEIFALTGGRGATAAMECAAGGEPKRQAVQCTTPWGRIALVSAGGELVIDAWKDVIFKQRTILGSYTLSYEQMKDCTHFIACHGVEVDQLFTDRWSLEQAGEAYRVFDKQSGGKGVFLL